MVSSQLLENISHWITSLDWSYILTFILIAYAFNQAKFTNAIVNKTGITFPARYRTLLVGVVYAILVYFFRGYDLHQAECLFQSLVFAFTFHKLIVDRLVQLMGKAFKGNSGNPPASAPSTNRNFGHA